MTITLKEFSQWVLQYINSNFLPLLKNTNPEHEKCISSWKQVSDLIRDIEKTSIWNLESYLKNNSSSTVNCDNLEFKQLKKAESTRPSANNFSTYETIMDKKETVRNTYSYEEQVRFNNNLKANNKEQSEPRSKPYKYSVSNDDYEGKLSFEPKLVREKSDGIEQDDGFDKLIQSFRKLYCSFENNHKKLLKEDKNLKQNMKVEVAYH